MKISHYNVFIGNGREVRRIRVDRSAADNTSSAVKARIGGMLSAEWTVDAVVAMVETPALVPFLDALASAGLEV